MAEIQPSIPESIGTPPALNATGQKQSQPRGPPLHQIYALPAPIRTFPLPTFYPNNPVSLFHVACAWLGQLWSPPPSEPAVVHQGAWSAATSSIHIVDEKSVRALWEQGFYGKGSLSRSEPNWLKREEVRRGLDDAHVSEILTVQRREERIRAKWERARVEQEAIRQTRLQEAREAAARASRALEAEVLLAKAVEAEAVIEPEASQSDGLPVPRQLPAAPVCPATILALPDSEADLARYTAAAGDEHLPNGDAANGIQVTNGEGTSSSISASVKSSAKDEALEDSETLSHVNRVNGSSAVDVTTEDQDHLATLNSSTSSTPSTNGLNSTKSRKRRKSVRFSPTVESTTYQLSDPPSPSHPATKAKADGLSEINGESTKILGNDNRVELVNKEHLQLMPEEAFFLSFGLGALAVTDPASGMTLSSSELLTLFRQYSYFPPRTEPEEPALQPDDKFLVHYAVYHHFRSLGWVPRGGIKFGVDWLLYTRGPVFDHAEFGLIVIPSYSDDLWKGCGKENPGKTWQWLHGTVRVLSHVTKSLVLVYVDVPPPSKFQEALERGISEALKLYRVREVMVKRWSTNRNR